MPTHGEQPSKNRLLQVRRLNALSRWELRPRTRRSYLSCVVDVTLADRRAMQQEDSGLLQIDVVPSRYSTCDLRVYSAVQHRLRVAAMKKMRWIVVSALNNTFCEIGLEVQRK